MPEVPGARSALDSVGRPASLGGGDLWVRERAGGSITHLEGPRPGQALTGCLVALGISDLPPPGSSAGGTNRLLPIGSGIWLLHAEAPPPLQEAFEVAIDVTGAWTRIAIGGAGAPALMAKGCALDLHPRAFPIDACAGAGFAGMRTIIRRAEDGFELLVGRSYALSLWEWLVDAAAEYLGEGAGADRTNQRERRP